MKKNRTPPITPNLGPDMLPLDDQIPFRPFGTTWELWGGAVGIDHSLQIYDIGPPQAACGAAHVTELTPRDRDVLADYMIALWTAFKTHPV